MTKDIALKVEICQAAEARTRLLETMNAYPSGPHPDFPAYSEARIGAAAQVVGLEGWRTWALGGFVFADGSVLRQEALRHADPAQGWYVLTAPQAAQMLGAQVWRPLQVYLLHTFTGVDGRRKSSVAEARFEHQQVSGGWHLHVEYEAYMDSPLYGLEADCFGDLLELNLWNLLVDTPQPNQRWRLEHIALHPDWLELLSLSREPSRG